ncbi:3-dehydroquinate synthase [Rhodoblastus acidophilus]|uniref:Multifunctional fusion protein n=2 Tax=Candidatus Rhodoblastus alkanivorans TaxID=2954117 RepID=A0ABS9Z131_9HYPH|nr:3-dehydroquinate synthase [Candidatus Rhodoblastus alkanivorans]MCI4678543.1 3-dehydroquinate synthase [Candidatus Rhodoblastus alkanivorans]MCI4681369.1 3-dehydroquinate synthase [Candidatus Rhodoblastus alkanivorans]MDI4642417.1 3-dehydroquinate synthase [Rhodoblastus acidophilus]
MWDQAIVHPPEATPAQPRDPRAQAIVSRLAGRPVVLVGMMGSGKTAIGKRLAQRLGLPFVDSDHEIEAAHRLTIAEIFALHGEAYFRDGERRVLARLIGEGERVIATGGGAFIQPQTRGVIRARAVSIWLKAEFEVLMRRVRKRPTRPLLHDPNPEGVMRRLIDERYPVYAEADLVIQSRDGPHEAIIEEILAALEGLLAKQGDFTPEMTAPVLPPASTGVHVALGARAYDILIGPALIAHAGERLARLAPGANAFIVTDAHVAPLWLGPLEASLDAARVRHGRIVLPAGETTKDYAHFEELCEAALAAKMERGDFLIALGGGVIGDLTGFAAASLRRGMGFIQIPTTLLSQVDSSVGGKTGINSRQGKNLIGAFHQPALVLADTDSLATLPPREFAAGYAEVVKYGLIDRPDFFAWLEKHWPAVFARGPELGHAIAVSCESKAAVVARDETEQGDRALLNLGHTFGHALEKLVAYDSARLVHGEGVAIGMACAFRYSSRAGLCPAEAAERVEAHLRAVGLPTRISDIAGWSAGADDIVAAMAQDKKVQRGALTFILARDIGASFIAKNVEAEAVRAFLDDELRAGV